MPRRDSDRPLRRSRPSRDPLPRMLVVCEGKVTEPGYFREFAREERNRLVEVIIDDQGGSPKTLVERAASQKKAANREAFRMRDDNLKYDEVWCVFDVDQHPKLADAHQQARDNGIRIAVSNPCFELWLLLHYQEQTAFIERTKAAVLLRGHVKGYEKHVDYSRFRAAYEDAVRRASQLTRRHSENGTEGGNPSTTVYELTERIRELGSGTQP
jgi:hypothetical protein